MPLTRVFFCDPPGRSDPDALLNFGADITELNYIFFHDQEPIHLDLHRPLFDDVAIRNVDLNHGQGARHRALVTSEWNSSYAEELCKIYDWKHYYYFYHGWAAIDWYRGYHRTWLMPAPEQRVIRKSFINPNRIIGGKRDHRVLLLYHLFRQNINNAWISCPKICPVENQDIADICRKFQDVYPDIQEIFNREPLPKNFPGETGHPMHSCWLSLFNETSETLAYVITETVFFGRRNHLTEKTFKPICQRMPFVMASSQGSLEYLRRYGFKTFGDIWDESYDDESDDLKRIEKISRLLKDLDSQSTKELQDLYKAAMPAIEHNYQHFYGGDFEDILWQEMTGMLTKMTDEFRV